jgi:hypothetical protein
LPYLLGFVAFPTLGALSFGAYHGARSLTLRLQALRSLRWNYRWRGVWAWLKGRHVLADGRRGWQMVLREPQRVIDWQAAIADGVYV